MPKNSLAEKIDALELKIQTQQEMLDWMRLIIRMVGVEGPWVSPQVAGMATGRSRDRVMQDIEVAEQWRSNGRKWNMIYGVHYRNDQGIDATQATWKVHLAEYAEFTKIPPDQLKAG